MKTLNLILLSFALSFTFYGCEKYAGENMGATGQKSVPAVAIKDESNGLCIIWTDNFISPDSLKAHWRLIGSPLPEWKASAYGRNGLFDNNGPSPTKNYAISDSLIGRGFGYIVESEVMLQIINPEGTCVCPGIALTKQFNTKLIKNEIPSGISMRIIYAGANAIWFPAKLRNHTWFLMEFISENETLTSSGYIPADNYSNNWHVLKFEVTSTGYVRFSCDDILLWAPFIRIHPVMKSDNLIVLGYTSDGDLQTRSGEAYHNWVKATYAISPKK